MSDHTDLIARLRETKPLIHGEDLDAAADALEAQGRRLAELEAERTGTIHESWQHKTHAEVLAGLRWQGAITKSLIANNDELQARLAEAEALLDEVLFYPLQFAAKDATARSVYERIKSFRAPDSASHQGNVTQPMHNWPRRRGFLTARRL